MTEIFGEFNEILTPSQEYLVLQFSPSSIPLKQRWRNNGLSADFMAYYFMTFFTGSDEDGDTCSKQAEIKGAVSYIANELIENAMKFNDETSPHPISISLHLHQDKLIFLTTNSVSPEKVGDFQAYIQQLITSDTEELYISQLEKNAEDETCTVSRLGVLTMINDYLAKVGWKFETVQQEPKMIAVTTMVQLTV